MGHYRIIRRLAVGGMAEVYLGKRVGAGGFEKPVAIKRMLPAIAADRASAEAFLAEARLCVHLVHPNVVQVLDLGTSNGIPWLVMELVDGADLRTILNTAARAGRRLQPAESIHVAACVAEALAYADEAPGPGGQPLHVVHRDVNPSNVLVSMTGQVKLADFGVAKAADGRESSQGNLLKGKLGYLAPELLAGAPAQHACDIFLAGVLLWELLAGKPLFPSGGVAGHTLARIGAHDESQVELPEGAPPELLPVLRRALARRVEDRYGHARDLAADLRAILDERRWRVGREQLAALMSELFPGRPALDRDLPEGVPLYDDRTGGPVHRRRPAAEEFGVAPRNRRRRLGEMLIEAGLITESQLQLLLGRQRQEGGRLAEWAVALEFAPAREVLQVLARQLGVPFVTDEKLLEARPTAEMLARLPRELALRLLAMPISERDGIAWVAMTDPANLEKLDMIRFRLGSKVRPVVCTELGLRRAIARFYGGEDPRWGSGDAIDPLSLHATRVIDFEAMERQTPPPMPAIHAPAITPPAPPGYVLAYVPTGVGPDGKPVYVAVPVPQNVAGAAGAMPPPQPPAPAQSAGPGPRESARLGYGRVIDFGDDDLGEELELDVDRR